MTTKNRGTRRKSRAPRKRPSINYKQSPDSYFQNAVILAFTKKYGRSMTNYERHQFMTGKWDGLHAEMLRARKDLFKEARRAA